MVDVKQIRIKPIASKVANDFVKKWHYSGKIVNNSILHLGAFYGDILHGVMSFGSSLDKRKMLGLVKGTLWNEFLELNRMAFDDFLPKNSESRSLSIAFKIIKKQYPHIKWIISFADGTQCGDGTIYRASGFIFIGLNKGSIFGNEDKTIQIQQASISARGTKANKEALKIQLKRGGGLVNSYIEEKGLKRFEGFSLKYIYFLHPNEKQNLTVPILPFSKIDEMNAGMYKGQKRKIKCGDSVNARTNSISEVA